ncbi:hypothetical protein CERSUDRAFT_97938 [Gelatoporia subvermispora B]|uniref:F-box domain-containing protein n=1 Tax=Ceriporiopsis subvermispora (strain B) TaxID=914234 RepID=M2R6T6_CERS8|nr:hypothetical protein CERSUDRAFT_97938 [Gelatoporia subvermispora B]
MACRALLDASSPFALKVNWEVFSNYNNVLNSFSIQSRTLALRFDPSIQLASFSLQPDQLVRLLQDAKYDLMAEQLDFTLAHTQILRRMRVLCLRNDWLIDVLGRAAVTTSEPEGYIDFWEPILQKFEDVLCRINLTHLELSKVGLDIRVLECLSEMSSFRTLKLLDCPFLAILPPETSLRIASEVNADFCSDHIDLASYMEFVPLLSRLRCLVIKAYKDNAFRIPIDRPDFIQRCNPFGTLERLYIRYMRDMDVPGLCTWVRTSGASAGGLRLTRFKPVCAPGLQGPELTDLIDALAPAPLRVLVSNGIAYAELSLFDRLADAFPALKALTLALYRDPPLFEGEVCAWLHATWEYAPRFARFCVLKHFAWNLHTGPVPAPFPWDLPLMEAAYPESEVKRAEEWELGMEGHMFSEWNCIARMFLAHCGTLESLVLHESTFHRTGWEGWDSEDHASVRAAI